MNEIRIPVTLDVVGTEKEIRRWATDDYTGLDLLMEDRRKCAAACREWVAANPGPSDLPPGSIVKFDWSGSIRIVQPDGTWVDLLGEVTHRPEHVVEVGDRATVVHIANTGE